MFSFWAGRRSGPPRVSTWSIMESSITTWDVMATLPNQRCDWVCPECAPGQLCNPHLPHSLPRTPQCHHFEDVYFWGATFQLGTAGLRPQTRAQGGVAPLLRNGLTMSSFGVNDNYKTSRSVKKLSKSWLRHPVKYIATSLSIMKELSYFPSVALCVWCIKIGSLILTTRCQIWCTIEFHRDPISKVLSEW